MSSAIIPRLKNRIRAATFRPVPRRPSTDCYLFDHIPRTGGTWFAEVLEQLVGSTTPNFDCGPDYPSTHADEIRRLDGYRVVNGHLRLDTVKAFRLLRPRRLISLVRDPAAQIESVYTFWRHNVTESLPHCDLAKQLSFSEFVRVPELRMVYDNPFTRHFFSLWDLEHLEVDETSLTMAIKLTDSYDFIGVTERFDDTLRAFTKLFATRSQAPNTQRIDRNASKGRHQMSEDDAAYLRDLNRLDYAIYRHVNDRLDAILAQ